MATRRMWSARREGTLVAALGLGVLIVPAAAPWLALVTLVVVLFALAGYGLRVMASGGANGVEVLHLLARTVVAAWAIAAVAALAFSSASAAAAIMIIASCTGAVVVARRREHLQPETPSTDDVPRTAEVFQEAVAEATDDQLCELWQRSASVIRHSYGLSSVSRYVEFRQLILDEAERRSPEVVARWLADDPSSDRLRLRLR